MKHGKRPIAEIDEHDLLSEWLNLPEEYEHWSLQLTNAKAELLRAEADVKVAEADVSMKIRKRPAKYGIDGKLTEDIVKKQVVLHDAMREANDRYNDYKSKVDFLQSAIGTIEVKKRTLENLVTLYGLDYYKEPKVPKTVKHSKISKRLEEDKQKRIVSKTK